MRKGYLACGVGVLAVSFAALFIRTADAHPIVIAFMRMSLASAFLVTLWLSTVRIMPAREDIIYIIGAGVFLALHFVTWIASFGLTSVASSVVLVTMQPLFVLFLSRMLFKERITLWAVVGVGLCLLGALIIALSDVTTGGQDTLFGNALALSGALFAALYFLCGKQVCHRLHILPYVSLTYLVATLVLGAMVLTLRLPLGPFSAATWRSFAGLAIICTVLGHSSFNYAIAYLPASVVSVATLGEPVGASLLAALLLAELPTWGQIAGGVIIISGIYMFTFPNKPPLPDPDKMSNLP